jgi:hypothetical protein
MLVRSRALLRLYERGGLGAGNGFRPMLRVTSVVHSESFKDAVYPHGSLNIPFIKGELVAG